MQSQKRQRTEAQEWCFRLMNDPEYFEKWRYIDSINVYNSVIEELQNQKLYEQTRVTNRFIRARCLKGIRRAQRELAKTQAEYEIFKKYKTRTAISK
jgi:SOS response regulatory protein OraA/RecX